MLTSRFFHSSTITMKRFLRQRRLGLYYFFRVAIGTTATLCIVIPLLQWKYGFYYNNAIAALKDFINPWRFSFDMNANDENTLTRGRCNVPVIEPFREDVSYLKKLPALQCKGKRYGALTKDGQILINAPQYEHGYVEYIQRAGDDNKQKYSSPVNIEPSKGKGMTDILFQPTEDFFRLTLYNKGEKHEEYHATVVPKSLTGRKSTEQNGLNINIALVMFDSQSNANMQRMMPMPYKFLTKERDTVVLRGHTIVGDGTTAQLCAILTGLNEQHLPETRRSMPGSQYVDSWPMLYSQYMKKGYVTMLIEDMSNYATFNYRLNGFNSPPTDHYGRHFMNIVENRKDFTRSCVNDVPLHKTMFDYTLQFYRKYKDNPKFSLTQIGAICHNTMEGISVAEDDFTAFLHSFNNEGHFNNTIFILFGDHGARTDSIRGTVNGKLEERLPYMSLSLPPWFKQHHKELYQNLLENSKFLTTHFDIHATFTHLLSHPDIPKERFGRSLFSKFDVENRGCAEAGVADHWCPCLELETVNPSDRKAVIVAKKATEFFNSQLRENSDGKSMCAPLSLSKVLIAQKKRPNWKVEQFSHSRANERCDSCVLVFDKRLQGDTHEEYQVAFSVLPSNGSFEVTATVSEDNTVKVSPAYSRINLYGSQPHCLAEKWPNLRNICYCNVQL